MRHRHGLGVAAAAEYPAAPKAFRTPLLTTAAWLPAAPLALDAVGIELRPGSRPFGGSVPAPVPTRPDGTRYRGYAEAMAELAAPAVFENRPTYRLLHADLAGPSPRLTFGWGRYFDGLDVGEAAAHEYAAGGRTLRRAVGDPCDLTRRPANLAISTLTLCVDRPGEATFLLHRRDPAKVGHAGGLYQVLPVGVFQPVDGSAADFSLWHCMVREYAEELLGEPEPSDSPVDYDAWPFAAAMTGALRDGGLRAFVLGLGVDPLTFATDLLTVLVVPRPLFTELFPRPATENAEGHVIAHVPFTAESVRRFTEAEPMQAAGAALLNAAWANAGLLAQ